LLKIEDKHLNPSEVILCKDACLQNNSQIRKLPHLSNSHIIFKRKLWGKKAAMEWMAKIWISLIQKTAGHKTWGETFYV